MKTRRRFVGIELKPSYARTAAKNLRAAEGKAHAPSLFDALEAEQDAIEATARGQAAAESMQGSMW